MTKARALLVTESASAGDELALRLAEALFTVRCVRPCELAAAVAPSPPDAVLVSAELGLRQVTLLSRLCSATCRDTAFAVFPGSDPAALELCASAGFDFVAPPYLPGLLRNRLTPPAERLHLVRLVETAVAEARLFAHERDLRVAQRLQLGFLPERLPSHAGWEFQVRFRPALHMSGDFYDAFELMGGRRLGFVVADVCDKGMGAALFMAVIRTLLRHEVESAGDIAVPADGAQSLPRLDTAVPPTLALAAGPLLRAVEGTNRYLARHHLQQAYFATLFFGVLDPDSGDLLFVNAGHNPGVVVGADGRRHLLGPTGPAVGIMSDSTYAVRHLRMSADDLLFLYTDGVVEARSPGGEPFGTHRLLAVLEGLRRKSSAVMDTVDEELAAHVSGHPPFDDITMMTLRRFPEVKPDRRTGLNELSPPFCGMPKDGDFAP